MRNINMIELAMLIVAAEEARRIQLQIQLPQPSTKVELKDVQIPTTLIDEEGAGVLKELMIKSKSGNYTLQLSIDGSTVYNHTWNMLREISQTVDEISAFQDEEDNYILHLYDLKYSMKITVALDGEEQTASVFYKIEKIIR